MNILLALTILFSLRYFIFLYGVYRGIRQLRKTTFRPAGKLPGVSITVAFRNEETNLERCFLSLTRQVPDAEFIELIFINDHSTDKSVSVLEQQITSYTGPIRVSLLHSPEGVYGKKRSLGIAIGKATGAYIVTTDADCYYPDNWLRTLLTPLQNGYDFVAGPVKLVGTDSLFMRMQQLEHAGLVLTAAGMIGNNTPVTCNGANVAFTGEVFRRVNGYEKHSHLSSGDDEILMQEIAYSLKGNITFCFHPDAVVSTAGVEKPKDFLQQRVRWASKGKRYPMFRITVLLVSLFFFFLCFAALSLAGLFNATAFEIVWGIFIVKLMLEYLTLREAVGVIFEKINLLTFLLNEFIHIPYILFAAGLGFFSGFTWKDRKLKK